MCAYQKQFVHPKIITVLHVGYCSGDNCPTLMAWWIPCISTVLLMQKNHLVAKYMADWNYIQF